jgi:hypothetical protein
LVKFSNEFENQEMGKFENQEIEIQKSKVKRVGVGCRISLTFFLRKPIERTEGRKMQYFDF